MYVHEKEMHASDMTRGNDSLQLTCHLQSQLTLCVVSVCVWVMQEKKVAKKAQNESKQKKERSILWDI